MMIWRARELKQAFDTVPCAKDAWAAEVYKRTPHHAAACFRLVVSDRQDRALILIYLTILTLASRTLLGEEGFYLTLTSSLTTGL